MSYVYWIRKYASVIEAKILGLLTTKNYSRTQNQDIARRESILHILLRSSIFLSFVSILMGTLSAIPASHSQRLNYMSTTYLVIWAVFIFFVTAYIILKKGNSRFSTYMILGIYFLIATYEIYQAGADIPIALLVYALIVIMSGILINAKFAFYITVLIFGVLLVITYAQTTKLITINSDWKTKSPNMIESVMYGATLFTITIVSWLFNKESEKALKRARRSELALQRQKDRLEIIVEERTQELKQVQAEKMAQIYRFAEFGRSASGIFHDLVNPLTLVSLNLARLQNSKVVTEQDISDAKVALERAIAGTKKLESFIQAARKQLQNQEILQLFYPLEEVEQTLSMLEHKIKETNVQVTVHSTSSDIEIYGNPIKFSQLMINLLSNAIDSYEKSHKKHKLIEISIQEKNGILVIKIRDEGSGIHPDHLSKIFEPFFTTKRMEKGTGLGLTICKDIVEKSFGGKISVTSKLKQGTMFTIEIPIQRISKEIDKHVERV